jgi:ferredoxin
MIITGRKDFEKISESLAPYRKLAVMGCGLCAATCETGGEKQVREMARMLTARGKEIVGELMVEGVCHKRLLEQLQRREKGALEGAEALLVLACGSGTQTVSEVFAVPVCAGLDTLFLGQIRRHGDFRQVCMLCGDCGLEGEISICPIARCPKSLVNGPCGGAEEGRCEVIGENRCVWIEIFEESTRRGKVAALRKIKGPRDHSRSLHPGHVVSRKR